MNNTDAVKSVSEEFEKMKNEGIAFYREGKPNLAELRRRTGISRQRLRTMFRKGLGSSNVHGNTGKVHEKAVSGKYAEIANELLKEGVSNSSVIQSRLEQEGYEGSESSVKRYVAENRFLIPADRHLVKAPQSRVTRYETEAGEMFQMDWGFVKVVDYSGNEWRCACFAMVCHHCGMRYVEFFPNAKQESLFIGMIHSFIYMGMPEIVLTDNMASVVKGRDAQGKPIFNTEYDQFQNDLGFNTKLCKARHPWTKGAVERLVRFVKENFIQGRRFINITDLNEQALSWCNMMNSRPQLGKGVIPCVEHKEEPLTLLSDTAALLPYLAPIRKIGLDGFVYYEGRRYGVPYSYQGQKVRVMRKGGILEILDSCTFSKLETHNVDWSCKPHYSATQFEPMQPEELPTAPIKVAIGFSKAPADDFEKYDF